MREQPEPGSRRGRSSQRPLLDAEGERFKEVMSQVPAIVNILRGPDLVFELVHPCTARFLGGRDLQGRPLLEAMPEHRGQPFYEMLQHVMRTGETVHGTEVLAKLNRRNSGRLEDSYWNYTYVPLRNVDGEIEGVMTFHIEVTEQVLARQQREALMEALKEADQRKDEFLAMLAHELRNPLAPMQTAAYLMRKQLAGSPAARHLEIIERQANHLARIVDDLLDVSRITHGTIELRKERMDVGHAISRSLDATRSFIESRRHEVSVSLPLRPVYIEADAVRLDQIMTNLLTNAAKYTEPGGSIMVSVERAGEMAELRVRDTGMGIDEQLRPHLFELFRQGNRDLARKQGGLGIGLTIVHNLVQLHGGTIDAKSDGPGAGSEFIVRIPYVQDASSSTDAVHASPAKRTAEPGRSAPARRVLVVDDNHDAAESLAQLVQLFGHEVRFVFDGPSAIEVVEQWRPDLLFLDIGLPGMDGYQVAKRLRSKNAAAPMLVALTGYGQESDRRKSREAGFAEHLVKPPKIEAIEAILSAPGDQETRPLH